MADRCRTCKAPIRWAITDQGYPIPLDLEPVDDGNLRLAGARYKGGTPRALHVAPENRAEFAGELYRTHFVTCPYAEQHRQQ
jgi:hypothetical protein